MKFINLTSLDARYNLAVEEYVFNVLANLDSFFMLWQNDNTIVLGKHQNTLAEINLAYVKEKDITVVRRLSGGGAVYHDLGNINYTFIVRDSDQARIDFANFCKPMIKALAQLGVTAKVDGRNDMTIDGKKFSGSAQYLKDQKIMHHGTILYNSNLAKIQRALNVSKDKLESKGVKSTRSRVTNVADYVNTEASMLEFRQHLIKFMDDEYQIEEYQLSEADKVAIEKIKQDRYDQWSWNYGKSPEATVTKERRIEGCGKIIVYLKLDQGKIIALDFRGDYFSVKDHDELVGRLLGQELQEEGLRKALADLDLSLFFAGLKQDDFIDLLLI